MKPALVILATLILWSTAMPSTGQPPRGILGQKAPLWQVDQWVQLPQDVNQLDVNDLQGKVVYLYCFQSWCPGCHRHGFPTLQMVSTHFNGQEDVAFATIQTTFEGFASNTARHAQQTAERYGLEMAVGQSGTKSNRSQLMRSYRTGGTPWTIIIDRQGIVRFNDFHIDAARPIHLITELRR
jgi:thiol-disulfide isomerase/thioredoxin